MVDFEYIRKKHLIEGWSIRKIAKHLGISRQTVRKAVSSSEVPKYRLKKGRPATVFEPYRNTVQYWLEADVQAPQKQRHTAKRIYDRLVAEYDFQGSYSTVRRWVSRLKETTKEPFIPLTADFGEQAQVDWGQARVRIGGVLTAVHLFCLRMRASGVPFAWAYPTEKWEAFLDGHCRAFEWLGGVPWECVYDNPKTAVTKILAGPEREEHVWLSSLRAHYLFDSAFCAPAKGNEKGSVENLVGYVRRNALVPVPDVGSWEELNEHVLLGWCQRERAQKAPLWEQEHQALRTLPTHSFKPARPHFLKVGRLGLVHFDHNRYSVPTRLIGQTVRLDAWATHVEIYDGEQRIAKHDRHHGRKETLLSLEHYLEALVYKPRAAKNAKVVRDLPEIYQKVRVALCRQRPDGYRDFVKILLLHREFSPDDVMEALERALENDTIRSVEIRQWLLNQRRDTLSAVDVPEALDTVRVNPPDLERFDLLLGRTGS